MQQESRSMHRASLGHFLRRNGRTLPQRISPYTRIKRKRKKLTPNEQRIPCEHNPLSPILHEKANTILRMTRGMQSLDGNALANLERFPMLRRGSDR